MLEIKAPNRFASSFRPWLFLAGSIEQDQADRWQDRIVDGLRSVGGTILNPRREGWDPTLPQSATNPQFREQVTWELRALEEADLIVLVFDPKTRSPISLLELGLHARVHKMLVLCPKGYWRKGNVDLVCEMYHVEQIATEAELILRASDRLATITSWYEA